MGGAAAGRGIYQTKDKPAKAHRGGPLLVLMVNPQQHMDFWKNNNGNFRWPSMPWAPQGIVPVKAEPGSPAEAMSPMTAVLAMPIAAFPPPTQQATPSSPLRMRKRSIARSRRQSAASVNHKDTYKTPTVEERALFRQSIFQRFRVELWRKGQFRFTNDLDADAFIIPMKLSEEELKSPQSAMEIDQPGKRTVRIVVHSPGRQPFAIKRCFDMNRLLSTVPEPVMSPLSPQFDKVATLDSLLQQARRMSSATLLSSLPSSPTVAKEKTAKVEDDESEKDEPETPLTKTDVWPMRKFSLSLLFLRIIADPVRSAIRQGTGPSPRCRHDVASRTPQRCFRASSALSRCLARDCSLSVHGRGSFGV